MKLDRNINPDGSGKYTLLKMRLLRENKDPRVYEAWHILKDAGLIHWGDEGPGEQFFVLKYKDQFTHFALRSYANHVEAYAMTILPGMNVELHDELLEYAKEIHKEASIAEEQGYRIPD